MSTPHRPWIASAALLVTLLAACQRKDEPPAPPAAAPEPAPAAAASPSPAPMPEEESPPPGVLRAYVWDCGGTVIKARNLWRENAIAVDLHDGTHKLDSTPSASGAKYTDGSVTLATKGGAATLETPGNPAVQCGELRAQSLLEDARLRGVLYSGRGNEPGWTLEVGPGSALTWVTGYGQERHQYRNATASGDAVAGQVYSASDASGEFKATVTKTPCQDDMSGEAFDYRVVVRVGGREYRGCGARAQP